MKKLIMTTVIAACIALCAAVWPKSEAVEEIPAPTPPPAVCAPETTVAELKTEVETAPPTEKEKAITPQVEAPQEISTDPQPTPIETPAVPVAQPTSEPEVAQEAEYESIPESTPEPASAPTVINPQPGDMVYVDGFGWLECQAPGEVTYAEDMYENGNKIGSMG